MKKAIFISLITIVAYLLLTQISFEVEIYTINGNLRDVEGISYHDSAGKELIKKEIDSNFLFSHSTFIAKGGLKRIVVKSGELNKEIYTFAPLTKYIVVEYVQRTTENKGDEIISSLHLIRPVLE